MKIIKKWIEKKWFYFIGQAIIKSEVRISKLEKELKNSK